MSFISQKAFAKLIELSEKERLSRWRILTRIIITQLPVYAKLRKNNSPTKRYNGDKSLISATNQEISNKGIEGERQVTYQITSRALKKLESYRNAIAQSKEKIIESNSDFDRQSFNNSVLTNFLLQNGCQVKHLKACYLKYLFKHSSKV